MALLWAQVSTVINPPGDLAKTGRFEYDFSKGGFMGRNFLTQPEAVADLSLFNQIAALDIEFDIEDDGRHIAEITALSGCLVYGSTRDDATRRVQALALRVIADRLEHGEPIFDEPLADR
jgi:predicted RNase H-like HicB family nuclease